MEQIKISGYPGCMALIFDNYDQKRCSYPCLTKAVLSLLTEYMHRDGRLPCQKRPLRNPGYADTKTDILSG